MASHTADKILDLAEQAICTKGYSAFSFRELAAQLGIKSASVHYHFPTKADLGLAVAKRYRERYHQALMHIERQHADGLSRLRGLVDIYRQELVHNQRLTLCTALATEMQLPDTLKQELHAFYQTNLQWLTQAASQPQAQAIQLFSLLQGAFTGGKTLGDVEYFDAAVSGLERLAGPQKSDRVL